MLTDVVRKSLDRVSNRFELVVITSERARQLMRGARATVENPSRERLMKVALREIVSDHILRDAEGWKVDRPNVPDIFTPPPPRASAEEILRLREPDEADEDAADDDEEE